jgi:chromosome segregation ATPase
MSTQYISSNTSVKEVLDAIANDPNATAREKFFLNPGNFESNEEISRLEDEITSLEDDLAAARTERCELEDEVADLEEKVKELKEEIASLKAPA